MNVQEECVQFGDYFYYRDGKLYNKVTRSPRQLKDSEVGSMSEKGYLQFQLGDRYYKVHRVIWELHYGSIPDYFQIDHRDKNPSNNLISNLRLATNAQNACNRSKRTGSIGSLKGTTYHGASGKWRAQIQIDGRRKHLGTFTTEEEAHECYLKASKEIYGDFASAQ